MTPKFLTGFDPAKHAAIWGQHTAKVRHSLADHPLFTDDALAELIERTPRAHYNLVFMGAQGAGKAFWRYGEIGNTSGARVIDAVRNGRMWVNLRHVHAYAPAYKDLVDQLFDEQEALVPGFRTLKRTCGILISSPRAQVYYHADVPGQSLYQIRGVKRFYIYPNTAPFLPPETLEGIVLAETEEEMAYEPWFDEFAEIHDLQAGEMVHWALNGPHRVENHDCLNVSMTTEHTTEATRRAFAMNYANGVMRRRLGIRPQARHTEGLGFWAKAGLAVAWKKAGLDRKHRARQMVDFRLSEDRPGEVVDIPAYVQN